MSSSRRLKGRRSPTQRQRAARSRALNAIADLRRGEAKSLSEAARKEGKPENIIAKMVEGRLRNFFAERVLLEQPFVKDDKQTIEKLLKSANARVLAFQRYEVGAGIEKKQEDFVAEVMNQVKAAGVKS